VSSLILVIKKSSSKRYQRRYTNNYPCPRIGIEKKMRLSSSWSLATSILLLAHIATLPATTWATTGALIYTATNPQTLTTSLTNIVAAFTPEQTLIYGTDITTPTNGEICVTNTGMYAAGFATTYTGSFTSSKTYAQIGGTGQLYMGNLWTYSPSISTTSVSATAPLYLTASECLFMQGAYTGSSAIYQNTTNALWGLVTLPSSNFLAWVQGGSTQSVSGTATATSVFGATAIQHGSGVTAGSLGIIVIANTGLYMVSYTIPWSSIGGDEAFVQITSTASTNTYGAMSIFNGVVTYSVTELIYTTAPTSLSLTTFSPPSASPTPTISATGPYFAAAQITGDYTIVGLTATGVQTMPLNTPTLINCWTANTAILTNNGAVSFFTSNSTFVVSKTGIYLAIANSLNFPLAQTTIFFWFQVARVNTIQYGKQLYNYGSGSASSWTMSFNTMLPLQAGDQVSFYGQWNSAGGSIIQCNADTAQFGLTLLDASPTPSPTMLPTSQAPTVPSHSPSKSPSKSPSNSPSKSPSRSPSRAPSKSPSKSPTRTPSKSPSKSPIIAPSKSPSKSPSRSPSRSPSKSPSRSPSRAPSKSPSKTPSKSPSKSPSHAPSKSPSHSPSKSPSHSPSRTPSHSPTGPTSKSPTRPPTSRPTLIPTTTTPTSSSSSLTSGAIAGITVGVIVVLAGIIVGSLAAAGVIGRARTTTSATGVAAAANVAHASAGAVAASKLA